MYNRDRTGRPKRPEMILYVPWQIRAGKNIGIEKIGWDGPYIVLIQLLGSHANEASPSPNLIAQITSER